MTSKSATLEQLYKQFAFEYTTVLQTTIGKQLFATHCATEYNLECFEFVEAVKVFTGKAKNQSETADRAQLHKEAQSIIDTYVVPQAPKQINIGAKIMTNLMNDFEEQQVQYQDLFEEALFATELLLGSDVFPRFLRSVTFLNFVKNATVEQIQSIGGTSLKHQVPITVDLFERDTITDQDFKIIMNLMKDCWSWRQVESDSKTNFSVYMGDTKTDPEVNKKYGNLTRFKTSYYFEGISAMELLNVAFSKQYLPTTFSQFKKLNLVKYEQGTQSSPSYFVMNNTIQLMPLSTIRENTSIVSIMYEPVQKVFVKITRSCIIPNHKWNKKHIPLYTVSGFFYQHIDDTRCKYTEILFNNSGGFMQYLFNENMIKSWAKTVQKGIYKAIHMYNKNEKLKNKKQQTTENRKSKGHADYQMADPVYFVPGLDENLKWISVAVNNYKNKYIVPFQ